MKPLYLLLLLLSGLLFTACKKENNTSGNGFIKAKVDGVAFASHGEVGATVLNNNLTMVGYWGLGQGFNFIIQNFKGTGTYPLHLSKGNVLTFTTGPGDQHVFVSDEAPANALVVTSFDNGLLKGSFNSQAHNLQTGVVRQVSEGLFEVKMKP